MNYSLIVAKNDGKKYNFTKLISNMSWSDDIETLGTKLNFEFARNTDDKSMVGFDILEAGDKVILNNGTIELFRGIITDLDWSRYRKGVTCFDYAFYLNQSKTVKQFYKIPASKAILELCKIFSIPIGIIEAMNTKITKIYKDNTIAEIIKDIISQVEKETGVKYRLEMKAGKLFIIKYIELNINPLFQPAENMTSFHVLKAIGDISKTESIQEMRNSILVNSDNEKSSKIKAETKDQSSINKFGLLQEVMAVDKKDYSQANNIAKNKLKELNKVQQDITLNLLGNDELRAGRILSIENPSFKLNGKYLIKSSEHTLNGSIRKTSVTVKEA